MFLADTLSRAYLPTEVGNDFVHALEAVDHTESLAISTSRLKQIRHASANDVVVTRLAAMIRRGWPNIKGEVEDCLLPYYDIRSELTVQDDLVLKSQQLVIPGSLRKELMAVTHASHMGLASCLRRMRVPLLASYVK